MIESQEDIQLRRKWVSVRLRSGLPLVPKLYGAGEENVTIWRRFLRRELAHDRKPKCERAGCRNDVRKVGFNIHEGIVKKNEISESVPSWWEIFSEYNCFILCVSCHMNKGPPRSEFYKMAVRRYGEEAVNEWLESLPFKHVFQPPEEDNG